MFTIGCVDLLCERLAIRFIQQQFPPANAGAYQVMDDSWIVVTLELLSPLRDEHATALRQASAFYFPSINESIEDQNMVALVRPPRWRSKVVEQCGGRTSVEPATAFRQRGTGSAAAWVKQYR
jgi:hypothetical protein